MTEFIENQQWLDFAPNNRAPSKLGSYDTIVTNWLLSRDPIGKLSIVFLFLIGWEIVIIGMITDLIIILIVAVVDKLILSQVSKAIETFTNKFLGWFFGISGAFTCGFIIFWLFKSGLWQKLLKSLSSFFL